MRDKITTSRIVFSYERSTSVNLQFYRFSRGCRQMRVVCCWCSLLTSKRPALCGVVLRAMRDHAAAFCHAGHVAAIESTAPPHHQRPHLPSQKTNKQTKWTSPSLAASFPFPLRSSFTPHPHPPRRPRLGKQATTPATPLPHHHGVGRLRSRPEAMTWRRPWPWLSVFSLSPRRQPPPPPWAAAAALAS